MKSGKSTSGKEISLFESFGTRSKSLEKQLIAMLTVYSTSVGSERAFSISGSIVVRRRARLQDITMDYLYF